MPARAIRTGKWQAKALGKGDVQKFWKPHFAHLYPKPDRSVLATSNPVISQSFEEFVEMGKQVPNEEGTGRFVVGDFNRRTIGVMFMKDVTEDKNLVAFIECFIGLPVRSIPSAFEIRRSNAGRRRKATLIDTDRMLEFPVVTTTRGFIDCFSLFDILVEYIPEDAFSCVLFSDFAIYDSSTENDQEVYGRACGDRVAVISTADQTRRDLFLTTVHELLHTLGVDHCESWACTMNPCGGGDILCAMDICPADLRKLDTAVGNIDLVDRWTKLRDICLLEGWTTDADWFAERIRLHV